MISGSLVAILAFSISRSWAATPDSLPLVALHELQVQSSGREITLSLAVFDANRFRLSVVDNAATDGTAKFKSLSEAMRALGALAGCNGGFFQREPFAPVGVMISNGHRLGRFDPDSWMKGALVVRAGHIPSLESTDSFQDTADITDLLQSGPWLVRGGRSENDDSRHQVAPRTFICHDGGTTWAIGNSSRCTLLELANALRNHAVIDLIDVREALNFDGGPSSGFWLKRSPVDFYLREIWSVRNFICLLPESAR